MNTITKNNNAGRFQKGSIPWNKDIKGARPYMNTDGLKLGRGWNKGKECSWKGEKHWNWQGNPKYHCTDCKKEVSTKRTKRCWECSVKFNRSENHHYYKGGKPKCSECGGQTTQYSSKMCKKCHIKSISGENCKLLGYKISAETIQKHRERLLGKTGPLSMRWIKDRTKLVKKQERNDSAYKNWRKQVWMRDEYKCKMKNNNCLGKIEAHHILGWTDYPELRYELNNGITLCHFHHPRKRSEVAKLSPFFKELLLIK